MYLYLCKFIVDFYFEINSHWLHFNWSSLLLKHTPVIGSTLAEMHIYLTLIDFRFNWDIAILHACLPFLFSFSSVSFCFSFLFFLWVSFRIPFFLIFSLNLSYSSLSLLFYNTTRIDTFRYLCYYKMYTFRYTSAYSVYL